MALLWILLYAVVLLALVLVRRIVDNIDAVAYEWTDICNPLVLMAIVIWPIGIPAYILAVIVIYGWSHLDKLYTDILGPAADKLSDQINEINRKKNNNEWNNHDMDSHR